MPRSGIACEGHGGKGRGRNLLGKIAQPLQTKYPIPAPPMAQTDDAKSARGTGKDREEKAASERKRPTLRRPWPVPFGDDQDGIRTRISRSRCDETETCAIAVHACPGRSDIGSGSSYKIDETDICATGRTPNSRILSGLSNGKCRISICEARLILFLIAEIGPQLGHDGQHIGSTRNAELIDLAFSVAIWTANLAAADCSLKAVEQRRIFLRYLDSGALGDQAVAGRPLAIEKASGPRMFYDLRGWLVAEIHHCLSS